MTARVAAGAPTSRRAYTQGVMDYHLKSKTAYVSAGAHGIGEAIADLLTAEGATVIVGDSDGDVLRGKSSKWRGVVVADLSTAEGVERCGRVMWSRRSAVRPTSSSTISASATRRRSRRRPTRCGSGRSQVNLMGCVRTSRALVPLMAKRGSGAVVNTGSDLAKQPEPGFVDYGTCKAGLLYLTKALAKQYAPAVRVNSVLPGPIWSRMWTRPGGIVDQLVAHYGTDRETAVARFLEDRQMPMGIGQPEDVAHAVVFLASPLAKFITGASLDIGGTIRGLIFRSAGRVSRAD